MCGRVACALDPLQICQAAKHRTRNGNWAQPRWRNPPGGQKYYTSYNIAPTSHTPVMISKKHVEDNADCRDETQCDTECEASDYIIQPMYWGLVPSWHKGEPKGIAYKMNNARSDGMLQKRSFKGPLEKGRRCVVLVDGYFEWHTNDNGKKQPYFISTPQSTDCDPNIKQEKDDPSKGLLSVKPESLTNETNVPLIYMKQEIKQEPGDCDDSLSEIKSESKLSVDKGNVSDLKSKDMAEDPPKTLLAMAGLFDVWDPKNGEDILYSYSIITVDAHTSVSFIHHRMPAILNGEDEILAWLNYDSIPLNKAVELIRPKDCIKFHPVSMMVNKVQNKSEECIKPVDLSKPQLSKSSLFLSGWLAKGKSQSQENKSNTDKKRITAPKKSPAKANLMFNWLGKTTSPQTGEKESGQQLSKRPRRERD